VTGENLSIGGKASGTVQSDGSFTAQGGLAVQTQARIQGKIQGNTIRATYTQRTRNATCTGTLQAVRQ
jgi:cytoskeletal protein CcmA (bactofilin family)